MAEEEQLRRTSLGTPFPGGMVRTNHCGCRRVRRSGGGVRSATSAPDALLHDLVFASRVGAFKSHSPKIEKEVLASNRSDWCHQATSRTTRSIPSTIGTGSWRDKRNRSHSSSTSSSSPRHSSKELASAQTPSKPGMEA